MMIRALLRKQLRELGAAFLRSSKTGKARSRASAMGYALLFAVLVVVLMLWLRCCSRPGWTGCILPLWGSRRCW